MSKLSNKLDFLQKKKDLIKNEWNSLEATKELSTKEKLEKLVNASLKREHRWYPVNTREIPAEAAKPNLETSEFLIRDFSYPLTGVYNRLTLSEWRDVSGEHLSLISGDAILRGADPQRLVFFDTETTGLSGGTGTIAFMLGFGWFSEASFNVRIFILNDLNREGEFLNTVDHFLEEHGFSGTVTYNGKTFDFPLMESRYILQRKRFPLLRLPHLDFLFPARTFWKNTCESRKLGYLGDVLLGLSREEDIDGAMIPGIYFNYLRSRSYAAIHPVVEHNALDLLGLAGLLLLGIKFIMDISNASDEGEILGTAKLLERNGQPDKAETLYRMLKLSASRPNVLEMANRQLSLLMKKKKLYTEAADLWEELTRQSDRQALRELAMHLEHREKNFQQALKMVRQGLEQADLTESLRTDFEKRLRRLTIKIEKIGKDEEKSH